MSRERWIPSLPPSEFMTEQLRADRAAIGDGVPNQARQAWFDEREQHIWWARWGGWSEVPPPSGPPGWNALHGEGGGGFPVSDRSTSEVPDRFWTEPAYPPETRYWR